MNNRISAKVAIVILLAAFLIILGGRFFSGEDNWICVDGRWVKHGHPESSAPATGCGENKNEESVIEEEVVEDTETEGKDNIIVTEPVADQSIGLPLVIKGQARVFENTFSYRIKNSDRKVIMESYAIVDSLDIGQFGPFEISLNYPDPGTKEGMVEVFEYSAKDGSEINKVEIPVIFEKVESTDVKIFFGNRKEDPDGENCGEVYEVSRRIPKVTGLGKSALSELIFGPYSEEEDDGYFSQINRNVKINKITVSGGVASVDFSKELISGEEGSCEKEMIKTQITETLKQFPTVKEVKITMDGEENVL